VGRGLAFAVGQAIDVDIHQGAVRIEIEVLFFGVVAQGVEGAAKRFVFTQCAALRA
jgi:hypothetical protein